jgi:AcrR family transcriptional regulator
LGPWQTDDDTGPDDTDGTALTEAETRSRERIARRQVDKFAERREELADAALLTLAEQGYANTSLRDIAQHSAFSHGVLHYYFADKFELISYCVRRYKTQCVRRYDTIVATAATAGQLLAEVGTAMTGSLRDDAAMHRLWYDLRNQSQFDERFRADVGDIDSSLEQMIWRIVSRYADLAGRPPAVSPGLAYALADGVFQQALLAYLSGDPAALDQFGANMRQVLPSLLGQN